MPLDGEVHEHDDAEGDATEGRKSAEKAEHVAGRGGGGWAVRPEENAHDEHVRREHHHRRQEAEEELDGELRNIGRRGSTHLKHPQAPVRYGQRTRTANRRQATDHVAPDAIIRCRTVCAQNRRGMNQASTNRNAQRASLPP